MPVAYYNEIEPYAAQWLRNLIDAGHIPHGVVDTRSIADVRPEDLAGFTQCHFFAGIGGWALAARLAGWPSDRELWTGSPPCQPFSVAGKGKAQADDRHLWPHLFRLIRACRPHDFVGEQVAAAVGKDWLDGVFADLESIDYAGGAVVVPACAVDAPHRRDRLWYVAHASGAGLAQRARERGVLRGMGGESQRQDLADDHRTRLMGNADVSSAREGWEQRGGEQRGIGSDPQARVGDVAHGECVGIRGEGPGAASQASVGMQGADGQRKWLRPDFGAVRLSGSAWSNASWLIGHDGKARRVEPGIRLLAHGVPARVGRLRAYGNAIVPQVAAEVIGALMDCYPDYTAVAA